MRLALVISCLALVSASAAADSGNSCNAHVASTCSDPGSEWTSGPCNAVYGGFTGNSNNLHVLVQSLLEDSFKFLIMGSHFSSDEVNRLGMHKTLFGHSEKMWQRSKEVMKYILKRGGKMGQNFRVDNLGKTSSLDGLRGEVEALGEALDLVKRQAENAGVVHKHALNKHLHADQASLDSFDPTTAHFIEETLLSEYSGDIRTLSGQLNVLAKITRNDNTKALGLHMFDESLLK